MKQIELCLTDDHTIVTTAIQALLASEPDIRVADVTNSAFGLLALLQKNQYDLVVLDIMMPGMTGLEALKEIAIKHPTQKVCMLTGEVSEDNICKAIELGALGFVSKNSKKKVLVDAIRKTASGETFLGTDVPSLLYYQASGGNEIQNTPGLNISLSDREMEVLKHLSDGLRYKEIGEKLFISARTVESHKNNILQKLQLDNIIQLVKFAIKNNMIQL